MKRVLNLLLAFAIIISIFPVFADELGSILINYVDTDTLEVIEQETLTDLELGEHIVSGRDISGYILDDTVTKAVYLEAENKHQTVDFSYKKREIYDGLLHINYFNNETGGVFQTETTELTNETQLNLEFPKFIESELLERVKVSSKFFYNPNTKEILTSQTEDDEKIYYNISIEDGVWDSTGSLTVYYKKIKLQIEVQYYFEGEMIKNEIKRFDELGTYTIQGVEKEGFILVGDTEKQVTLDYPNYKKVVRFDYEAGEVDKFDELFRTKFVNTETGEILKEEILEMKSGETLTIPVHRFIAEEMLEGYINEIMTYWTINSEHPEKRVKYIYDQNNFDENYIHEVKMVIPTEITDMEGHLEVLYRKIKPHVEVQYWNSEGKDIGSMVYFFDEMGTFPITAKEFDGYKVVGDIEKTVTLDYPNFRKAIEFYYEPIEPVEPPIEPIRPNPNLSPTEPSKPYYPSIPTKPIPPIENKPIIEEIPQGIFISRWEGHQIIGDPIKKEKQIIKLSIPQTTEGLTPRLYKWNEEKGKWVALATKIKEKTVESYEEVEGYIAIFAVKQPTFADVTGIEWFIEKLDRANGFAIVEGVKDKDKTTLNADSNITRKELFAMVGRIFGTVEEGQTSLYNELDFIVENQGGEWCTPYFKEFYDKGIIEKVFTKEQADEEVTRLEVLELLTQMINRVETVETVDLRDFKDTEGLDIQLASIVEGFPDGTLKLNNNISRIETITLLINTLEKLGW